MAIKVHCANLDCRKVVRVKDELAGKRVKCPTCGQTISVPVPREESRERDGDPGSSHDSPKEKVLIKAENHIFFALGGLIGLIGAVLVILSSFSLLSWWVSVPSFVIGGLVAISLYFNGYATYQCPVCEKAWVYDWQQECSRCRQKRRYEKEEEIRREFQARLDKFVGTIAGDDTEVDSFVAFWTENPIAARASGLVRSTFTFQPGVQTAGLWRIGWVVVTNRNVSLICCASCVANSLTYQKFSDERMKGTLPLERENVKSFPIADLRGEYKDCAPMQVDKWGLLTLQAPIALTVMIPALPPLAERLLKEVINQSPSG